MTRHAGLFGSFRAAFERATEARERDPGEEHPRLVKTLSAREIGP
jgi:hypothetical protein